MNRKHFNSILVIIILFFLSACTRDIQSEDIQFASVQGIDHIYIDYRSTYVNITSTNEDELKVSLFLYDNGPGIVMDKGNKNIKVKVKSDITRLFKIGRKPQLEIQIPTDYTGKIILDGSSGNIIGEELQTKSLQINGSSGNIQLDFNHFHGDVDVTLTSGNIAVALNENELNAMIHLKSNSGRRSVDFPLDNHKQNKKVTKGTSGDGEYKVELETSSGNIMLK